MIRRNAAVSLNASHLAGRFISTAASARCPDALAARELFQQFVSRRRKPFKRLEGPATPFHRAEAAVLMGELERA